MLTLLVVLVTFVAAPAGAVDPAGRLAIGDSVMLGAKDELVAQRIPGECRRSRASSAMPSLSSSR